MSKWQPIATAPKDGTRLLLFGRYAYSRPGDELFHYVGYWGTWDNAGGSFETWISAGPLFAPTHWMPLPDPP